MKEEALTPSDTLFTYVVTRKQAQDMFLSVCVMLVPSFYSLFVF